MKTILQEECKKNIQIKKKSYIYICFVDIEKAFYKVPKKVMEWTSRKKGLPEVIKSADEPLLWCQDESQSGISVIGEILGGNRDTSRICAAVFAFLS